MTVEQPQPVDGQVADLSRRCEALKAVLQRLAEDGAADEALQGFITAGALALLDIKASFCFLTLRSCCVSALSRLQLTARRRDGICNADAACGTAARRAAVTGCVVLLQGAHRAVCEAGEAARSTTAAAKQGLESLSLQLANLRWVEVLPAVRPLVDVSMSCTCVPIRTAESMQTSVPVRKSCVTGAPQVSAAASRVRHRGVPGRAVGLQRGRHLAAARGPVPHCGELPAETSPLNASRRDCASAQMACSAATRSVRRSATLLASLAFRLSAPRLQPVSCCPSISN